jgi:hypothetical protein
MGMFDWVEFECACPKCGKIVDSFQSKEGPCELFVLKPWQLCNFYSNCEHCGAWVEFKRHGSWQDLRPQREPQEWLDDYEVEYRTYG